MRSPPPPRAIAAWLAPFALYTFVIPVATMLAVLVESVWFGVPFSTLSLAPLSLSILYWVGRFFTVSGGADATASQYGMATAVTTFNHDHADRSRYIQMTDTRGLGLSAYSMYFFGLTLASILVYTGTVP